MTTTMISFWAQKEEKGKKEEERKKKNAFARMIDWGASILDFLLSLKMKKSNKTL